MVSPLQSIPIPYNALPEDVTRGELLNRVEMWREKAA